MSNSIFQISEGRDDALWINTGVGLYRLDRAHREFSFAKHDSMDPGGIAVAAIYEDRKGSLWFGTAIGLQKYDYETGKFIRCWVDSLNRNRFWPPNTPAYWVNAILEDERGLLWLATQGGLVEYDPIQGVASRHRYIAREILNPQHPENNFFALCQDRISGALWVGCARGLLSFDRKSKVFSLRTHEGATAICSERSGTLWLGTHTELKKLNRVNLPFRKYPTKDIACALSNAPGGALWIYVYNKGGWVKFDPVKEQLVPYSFGNDYLYYVFQEGDLALLKPDGSYYVRDTMGTTIFTLGPHWKQFSHSLSFGWKTKRGYYVGTHHGGLWLLHPGTQWVEEIKNLGQGIYNIYEDAFGLLWVATTGGRLFCYDQAKKSFAEFAPDNGNPSGRSAGMVNQIHEDKKGTLWIATSAGLERFNRSANTFTRFGERDGLPSDNVRGILEDDHGFLWINTTKGISKYDPDVRRFRNYDASYGLELASDVYYGWGCRARNGEMYFGGANGITRFHPDSVRENSFIPPVVLTSFRKFDKPYPIPAEIRLPYDENYLSFEFSALSYINPERNQYQYMMEGVDKEWVYSGTRRYASYPNLDPGEYVFRMKGSNNEGLWNETGMSIAIVISPPWWKTAWAYTFYTLALLSMGYYTWKLQVKRLRAQHEHEMTRFEAAKLHEVDELKSRFFANISHEFRTPLTLILGPVQELINKSDREEIKQKLHVVHKNANRLLGLVNQLLDLSKLESGNMKLQAAPCDVVSVVKGISQSFCSYAERKRISLTVKSTEQQVIAYIDKDKFEKILTNVLSNAFKFTPEGGAIEVNVKCTPLTPEADRTVGRDALSTTRGHANPSGVDQSVVISVSDTGIGIPPDKVSKIFDRFYQVDGSRIRGHEGTGIGLSLTREFVELHKGTIEVESQEGRGTTMSIRIPLGTKHLQTDEISTSAGGEELAQQRPGEILQTTQIGSQAVSLETASESGQPAVLIVEDNADVRDYIRRNLIGPYKILEAVDGLEGWNRSIEEMPDVVVSDVMMPNMDGFELCKRIKTDARTSHIPVILLTAKASSRDKIEGLDIGADDYILKPFEPEEVNARIRNLIEQRKRLHEHFKKHGLFELDAEKITPADQKFLQNALAVITKHMSDPAFGVELLAEEMAVSRSLLLKKCEALIGEAPSELIKRTRLNKGAQLVGEKFGNVTEIAMEVGFNNPSYFTECFRKQFGCPPSHYHRTSAGQKQN